MRTILIFMMLFSFKAVSFSKPIAPLSSGEAYRVDWPQSEYTALLSKAIDELGKDLLLVHPKDSATYGLKNTAASRKAFYMMLISSMARYESGFNPATKYYECASKCKYDRCRYVQGRGYCMLGGHALDGGLVISRGLLQLSLQSSQYYGCRLEIPEQLHDPETNIRCSVRILNLWVARDRMIGTKRKGGARYWSVLRESNAARKNIIQKTKALK
jgi:hypothetical protein